jgi:hypothetical protein
VPEERRGLAAEDVARRVELLKIALKLRDRIGATDTDPWLYTVLGRVGQSPDNFVGGHAVVSLANQGRTGETAGLDFRTPFAWDSQYDGYVFELCGLIAGPETDTARVPPEMVYPLTIDAGAELGGPQLVALVLRQANVMRAGVPIFGRAEWRPGWPAVEYSHAGVKPGETSNTRIADEGLRLFANIPHKKPGPKPGTGAKFKSAEAWRSAIREKVLTKETRLSADDDTIAYWLGIRSTTMYDLMRRWGPKTLEELRNGKS